MKVEPIVNGTVHTHIFFCPGCKMGHGFSYKVHTYNQDGNNPTVRASLLVGAQGGSKYLCHSFITDGMIEFLSDCTHA